MIWVTLGTKSSVITVSQNIAYINSTSSRICKKCLKELLYSWAYGKEKIRGAEKNWPDFFGLCPTSPEKIVCGTN